MRNMALGCLIFLSGCASLDGLTNGYAGTVAPDSEATEPPNADAGVEAPGETADARPKRKDAQSADPRDATEGDATERDATESEPTESDATEGDPTVGSEAGSADDATPPDTGDAGLAPGCAALQATCTSVTDCCSTPQVACTWVGNLAGTFCCVQAGARCVNDFDCCNDLICDPDVNGIDVCH